MASTILYFVTLFVTLVVIMSNSKFGCLFFLLCNFFNKIFANVLFFVRATSPGQQVQLSVFSFNQRSHRAYFQELLLRSMSVNKRFLLAISLSPELKTLVAFLWYSIASSRVSVLHTKFCPIDGTQMSLEIWCLRHISLLKFYSSEINVLQSLTGIFVM